MNRLVSESGLRPKRIHHSAKNTLTDSHKLAVRDYCVKLASLRGKSFLFLNECGFNLYTSTNYGYAMCNEDPILFHQATKGLNISSCGILEVLGIQYYQLIDGSIILNALQFF
ncbi:hypothetical protein CDIK_3157 [Cucumispora dikerogammari]|nr:hypothetical protein CDIK_3157 [Cucumispora dikerogammari]